MSLYGAVKTLLSYASHFPSVLSVDHLPPSGGISGTAILAMLLVIFLMFLTSALISGGFTLFVDGIIGEGKQPRRRFLIIILTWSVSLPIITLLFLSFPGAYGPGYRFNIEAFTTILMSLLPNRNFWVVITIFWVIGLIILWRKRK